MSLARIFLSSGKEYTASEVHKALKHLPESPAPRKILLFIHGRGGGRLKHPKKALTKMVPALESEYKLDTLLFNWQGSAEGGLFGFPHKRARAASTDLYQVLHDLETYKLSSSRPFEIALLTHSMGSIVLEETIKQYASELPINPFHSIVISAPASAEKNHHQWLEQSSLAPNHYVVFNRSDKALLFVNKVLRFSHRLGQGLISPAMAQNANYIDLSGADINHRYFIATNNNGKMTGQGRNGCISKFYKSILNNQTTDMNLYFKKTTTTQGSIYSTRSRNDPNCSG